jgi:hypothetical protein
LIPAGRPQDQCAPVAAKRTTPTRRADKKEAGSESESDDEVNEGFNEARHAGHSRARSHEDQVLSGDERQLGLLRSEGLRNTLCVKGLCQLKFSGQSLSLYLSIYKESPDRRTNHSS